MQLNHGVVEELRVHAGSPARLSERSTSATLADWLGPLGHTHPGQLAEQDLERFCQELTRAQELLFADAGWALLVVLQGPDAAGKDGTIKHVMSGVNPQGCRVASFKQPSAEELRHDYLWRCARQLPGRGELTIFNRSHYEEVVVCRVHPELLAAEGLSAEDAPGERLWRERYEDINAFERHLSRTRTRIVKIYLHVSAEEQRKRLIARLDDPAKQWKFSPSDLAERAYFADYRHAYEEALTATSTPWAPWYVVPADHKHALRALVGGLLVHAVDGLGLRPPSAAPERAAELAAARRALGAS